MGQGSGGSIGSTGQHTRYRESQKGTSKPIYDDQRAQTGIDALTRLSQDEDRDTQNLRDFYQRQMSEGQAENPYLENVISGSRPIAQKNFQTNLAQVRSGGYRGGQATDYRQQGQLASDFTNQQQLQENQMRMGDWNQRQQYASGGANSLQALIQSLSQNQGASAATLLNALRGTAAESETKGREHLQRVDASYSYM